MDVVVAVIVVVAKGPYCQKLHTMCKLKRNR